jgi:competence protein ComEA
VDPLLARLAAATPSKRRLIGAAVAIAAIVVLAVSVLVGALRSDGSSAVVRTTSRARSSSVATPSPSAVLVQVVGEVRRPGLVSVPAGSRVVDAIAAAGGGTARADESGVNLASRVVDGQQLVVPAEGRRSAAGATPAAGASAPAGGPVSLSSATAEQLETLPRIGPAMAARIIAWRTANGGFRSVNDLLKVSGIGARTLAGLRDLVTP